MTRPAALLLAGLAAISGCADLSRPPATSTTAAPTSTSAPSSLAKAQASHEYRSGPPPAQHASDPSTSPINAIRAFAAAYINWNAGTVAADMRALATRSVGQARSAMQLAAANTAQDYELQRGGIANRGRVEAVAPLPSGRGRFVVVTRERTTASNTTAYQGLGPAWHVTLATVTQPSPGRWVLSGWQPET